MVAPSSSTTATRKSTVSKKKQAPLPTTQSGGDDLPPASVQQQQQPGREEYAKYYKTLMARVEHAKALFIYQTDGTTAGDSTTDHLRPGDVEVKATLDVLCSDDEWGAASLPLFMNLPSGKGGHAIHHHCQKQLPNVRAGLEPYRELILKHIEAGTCLSIGVWPKRVLVPFLSAFEKVPEVGSPCLWRMAAHLENTHSILSKIFSNNDKQFMDLESFSQLLANSAKQAGSFDKVPSGKKQQRPQSGRRGSQKDNGEEGNPANLTELQRRLEGGADAALLAYELATTEMNLRARIRHAGGQISTLMTASKKVDRSDTAQVELLRKWHTLGFSPSDMAILHPTPLSHLDVAKALQLRDSTQKPTGKVAATVAPGGAEWLSTKELQATMNECGGPERLCSVLLVARGKAHGEWLSFLQRVHAGEAEVSDCPSAAVPKRRGSVVGSVAAKEEPDKAAVVPSPQKKTRRGGRGSKKMMTEEEVPSSTAAPSSSTVVGDHPPVVQEETKSKKKQTKRPSVLAVNDVTSEMPPPKKSRRGNKAAIIKQTTPTQEEEDYEEQLLNDLMTMDNNGDAEEAHYSGGGAASSSSHA